jgi:hypothetical protein
MRVIKLSDVKPISIGASAGAGAGASPGPFPLRGSGSTLDGTSIGGYTGVDGFGMDDFLQKQLTATYLTLETANKELEIKQRHKEALKASLEELAASIDAESDAETKAALQKDAAELEAAIMRIGEYIAAEEKARQHIREQITWLQGQYEQEKALREKMSAPTVWTGAGAGAGAGACACANAYGCGNKGCGTLCSAGYAGPRPTAAPPSLYDDLHGVGNHGVREDFSYLETPFAYSGGGGKKAAANTVVESDPVFMPPFVASMKSAIAGAGAGASSDALSELEEIVDDDDGSPEPWEAESELGPFSRHVEGRLRELMEEIQQQRIKEPDATTWLYHISGAIESAKLDLAS